MIVMCYVSWNTENKIHFLVFFCQFSQYNKSNELQHFIRLPILSNRFPWKGQFGNVYLSLSSLCNIINTPRAGQICTTFISPNLSVQNYRTRVYCSNTWTKYLVFKTGFNIAQLVKNITTPTYNKIPSIRLNISAFFIKSSNQTSYYKTIRHY